jgi:hypothetical protein
MTITTASRRRILFSGDATWSPQAGNWKAEENDESSTDDARGRRLRRCTRRSRGTCARRGGGNAHTLRMRHAASALFSDTYAYGDLKLQFVYSCYLVKHGDDYLLWDTGHAMTMPNVAPKVRRSWFLSILEGHGASAAQPLPKIGAIAYKIPPYFAVPNYQLRTIDKKRGNRGRRIKKK